MKLSSAQSERLGSDAFVFGFPLLLTAAMLDAAESAAALRGDAPLNRFAHLPHFPSPSFRTVVGAHPHSLYSLAWLDLGAEPLVLKLPKTNGRSYLMPVFDAWTNLLASFGPRTTGSRDRVLALVGPSWRGSLPEGMHRVAAPTRNAWAICHLHAEPGDELDAGRAIQRELAIVPLGDDTPPGPLGTDEHNHESNSVPTGDPHRRVMEMGADEFLGRLALEMGGNPPSPEDGQLLDRLREIGLLPGRPFAWRELPEDARQSIETGVAQGRTEVERPPPFETQNGWHVLRRELGPYGTDYVRRARIANSALGIAHPEDAIFPFTAVDGEEKPLHGSHRYVVRFEPDSLPPVGALWSLALYDMDQFFVDNPLDRYALGSRDKLEMAEDGSVEIAIQHERPRGSHANWLPAPEENFNLMLHMYWPERSALNGGWKVPPVRRVD